MGKKIDDLKTGFIHQLKNKEFADITFDIITKFEGVELKDEHLAKVFTIAKNHMSSIKNVGNDTFEHLLTEEIQELAEARFKLISSIRRYAETAKLVGVSANVAASKKILFWLKPHRGNLKYAGGIAQRQVVFRMQNALEDKSIAGLDEALELLNCADIFEEIVSQTSKINAMLDRRQNDISEMKKEVKEKRKAAFADFKTLLRTLITFANLQDDNQEEYIALSNKVREVIIEYNAKLLSRRTLKRNQKDAAQDEEMQNEAVAMLSAGASDVSDETIIAESEATAVNNEFSMEE